MARLLTLGWLPLALLVGIFLSSCGSGADTARTDSAPEPAAEAATDAEPETAMDDEEYDFILPSPLQIAAIFKKSGLDYAAGVTNPVENINQYTSQTAKALNFGCYSADLSYCVLNDQTQEARNYLNNVKQLSEDLGMSSIFTTKSLFTSFERNIGNQDSTLYLLATIQEQLDDYLAENQQEYMTSVFFAGAFVEGMYIGSRVSQSDNSKLARRLVEQLTILENLMKALSKYPDPSEELNGLMAQLKNLDDQFNNLGAIKQMREQGEEFEFETATFTDAEIDGLASTIQSIRNTIVNG